MISLCDLNKYFGSNEQVDRLFLVMYRIIVQNYNGNLKLAERNYKDTLEQLIWSNFECVKKSFILIPKL